MLLPTLSLRTRNLHASPIREILAVIDRPGMISFAGGLPAEETFPELEASSLPRGLMQYGASEGEPALRERVAAGLCAIGLRCDASQILILSGSQQGIDLVAKLLVDADSAVAVESPTYLAALQVLRFFGARLVPLDPDRAEGSDWQADQVRLAYINPTFQNPTGACYSRAQRERVARACDHSGVVLFEDDPYRDLVYEPCERTPVCAFIRSGAWIYQGSFSKSLAPGLRLGFLAASTELIPMLTRLKQAADLHSNRLSQWLVLQQLLRTDHDQRLAAIARRYRDKRDAFDAALTDHLGKQATWNPPAGGLFFWLRLHQRRDTRPLLARAVARNLAFMPGEAFFAQPEEGIGTLRLNFSHASEAGMHTGLATLSNLLEA